MSIARTPALRPSAGRFIAAAILGKRFLAAVFLAVLVLATGVSRGADAPAEPKPGDSKPDDSKQGDILIFHEWGTFTSLQDEEGRCLGGINVDDEPLPNFVHDVSGQLIDSQARRDAMQTAKGLPALGPCRWITMRLETPVIYFYSPPGRKPLPFSVFVKFPGGWLTQFYPNAVAETPGLDIAKNRFGPITEETLGALTWKKLVLGGEHELPKTESKVWLAPRAVKSEIVTTADGKEHERYLFYRGVGNVPSPISVTRPRPGAPAPGQPPKWNGILEIKNGRGAGLPIVYPRHKGDPADGEQKRGEFDAWLVSVRPDKSLAFRGVRDRSMSKEMSVGWPGATIGDADTRFAEQEFNTANAVKLRAQMKESIVKQGLFDDEADAMLNTWQSSYFESPGMRIFFLVPKQWTDHALPLTISEPSKKARVMVGRVEVITDEQREIARSIGGNPQADAAAYAKLGRFRDAILLDEMGKRPRNELNDFLKRQGVRWYGP